MTPLEYEALYKNLKVEFVDTTILSVTLSIHQYFSGTVKAEGSALISETKRRIETKGSASLQVKVNGSVVTLDKWDQTLSRRLVLAFEGKGAPEDYQIVAQLVAVLTNRWSASDLQSYCDSNLGIDCNGFVGNYLFHRKNAWPALFMTDEERKAKHFWGGPPDPGMTVDGFFDRGTAVSSLAGINPALLNVLGFVDPTTFVIVPKVIMKGSTMTEDAHVAITEPGQGTKTTTGIQLRLVESTGKSRVTGKTPGLTDNTCMITEFFKKGKPVFANGGHRHRVFNVHRDSKNQDDQFAICSFTL